jgi:excinuclease ABC subunit A
VATRKKPSPSTPSSGSPAWRESIRIRGARVHNLRNISVEIPRRQLAVVTGVSGSGKSSLTMDTLYAEGQRRYVESLSAYARQFLGRMQKPDVDAIDGLCPAIALEQKVITRSSRSTVGSLTEIYDYLRLLYARIGKTYSPVSGEEVRRHQISDVVDFVASLPAGTRVQVLAPLQSRHKRTAREELNLLAQKGYVRVLTPEGVARIDELLEQKKLPAHEQLWLVVDRLSASPGDEDLLKRVADSAQSAFQESHGDCAIDLPDHPEGSRREHFSVRFERDGMAFELPSDAFFNYNNPYGACKRCEGFGTVIGIDPDLVIPDRNLSVYQGAVLPWKGDKMSAWQQRLIAGSEKAGFPIHRPIRELSPEHYAMLWQGSPWFEGLDAFFRHVEEQSYKIQYRVMLSRYRGRTTCPECRGTRLRADAHYVRIAGLSIADLLLMPVGEVQTWIENLELPEWERQVGGRILVEIRQRLGFMTDLGLGYLTLNRLSSTLSGGESQRINLTRTLGSNLTSSLYILDEPSVGLHPRDTARLVRVLHRLRDLGNTVVVVEHEEDIMKAADYIVDMGPRAGVHGGQVVAAAPYAELLRDPNSLTAAYLSGREQIPIPPRRRRPGDMLRLQGARQHNLRNLDVDIPLHMLVAVTGVSGSGKTTLVKGILAPALQMALQGFGEKPGSFDGLSGAIKRISSLELVDQNPIGKSSRSNPVTYVKAYDAIRELFARQPAARSRGLQAKHFSFNVDGGRCDTCKGEGETVVEMQFLADIHLLCEDCQGRRFKPEVLEATYAGKNIHEVLCLSVEEAMDYFKAEKEVTRRLEPLVEVGLGYVQLGQSASTLSGGEAQRVKLASFLGKGRNAAPVLFIFDEPTTGLHLHDIRKLLAAFNALIERGHSVLVVEHNLEVIKCADWVIDLGPEGGKDGGHLVFAGTPEGLAACESSHTGRHLRDKLPSGN